VKFAVNLFCYFLILTLSASVAARSSQEYLPRDTDPDPAIPTPESILGWEVGDWHVSHDKLVQYMLALAAASPRVSVKETGRTYEQRPLLQLVITTGENQEHLDSLRRKHLAGDGPLVVWLGYSVHGDEPSGANASMLAAYYLASSRSAFVETLLADSVILIDPSINPDGLNRFASWANSNAGRVPVSDPLTRQHVQPWPEGRTNHYLFDLNRDWLPAVHPGSRARLVEFHRWRPHVLTDHHEQDSLPGFFFQPGVPSRQNPLTPEANLELTRALAVYHGAAMDSAGQPFFTEDQYDDFYFGKGSTYPDINGSIGILFEQRAILGQQFLTSNGTESFDMAVANHLRVSLSTLKGSWELRERLKRYQSEFSDTMLKRAEGKDFRAWVVGDDSDPGRAQAFLDLLDLHQIEYHALDEPIRAGGTEFRPQHAWVIPVRQRQFGLLEALMEQRTRFVDNTFYDVSAWTQPLAYNLPFAELNRLPATSDHTPGSRGAALKKGVPAYAIPWNQIESPAFLQRLLNSGAKVRAALKPFSAQTAAGLQALDPGTLVLQMGIQNRPLVPDILTLLDEAALEGLSIFAVESTMTSVGPDLGAVHFPVVKPVKPLIIGGEGVSRYEPGESWYLLDQRLQIASPMVELQRLESVPLANYTHLLLSDGNYDQVSPALTESIKRWVQAGGILVATGKAAGWAQSLCIEESSQACEPSEQAAEAKAATGARAYGDFADDKAQLVIGGAIVASMLDLSHPLTVGYKRPELPVLRRGTHLLAASSNP
jgi:hypothetical protein